MLELRISVRNLVAFILRSGDLDNRRSGADKEAMQQGSRLHRKIQGRMGAGYEAEVSLKYCVERDNFRILLEGRADGILKEEDRIVVDEIKAVYKDVALLSKPVAVHFAQAKCYAYMYAKEHDLASITVRMTYCHMETEQLKYFYETFALEDLQTWFFGVITEYEKWACFQTDWKKERDSSIAGLHFPFPYREQQKKLVMGVYRTIELRKRLFIQASTGSGKTISTIYPAVQAIGKGMADKIFYLTAKTITRTVAVETFQLLGKQKFQFKTVALTAKEKICFCDEVQCNPDACPYAKGHFDRINDCVFTLLNRENLITAGVIARYAKEYRVCPFELSLDVAVWVDAVICDYNYAFDYDVCLKRFFGEGNKEEFIFLVDEAHNLVERGRKMYSATLYKEDFLEVKRQVKFYSRTLVKRLSACNKKMLEWKRDCIQYEKMTVSDLGDFIVLLMRFMTEAETFLEEQDNENIRSVVLDLYFKVRHFLNIFDKTDENYVIYKEFAQNRFWVKLFCVNPSGNLSSFLEKGRSAVFFSATLLPVQYYMELLSESREDFTLYAESPFGREQCFLALVTDVSSRYSRRNQSEYEKIVDYIEMALQAKKGNYIVFLPSFFYMEQVYACFFNRASNVRCIVQKSHMSEEEREEFLQEFYKETKEGLVAFCVLGGIFGEGIDLRKDSLLGTIIVGCGMPQIGTEQELLQEYFQRTRGAGFDYAFRFPGFHKVLQAAGRVIRTEKDKGMILLLEERLAQREYQALYPKEWEQLLCCTKEQLKSLLCKFWL